jgi:3-oxoacyl-(acyl-carrier-protein) synthase
MRAAILDAGLAPANIDFLNVHGTGTPQNDAAEWQAIASVFGSRARDIPVTATKSLTGHLLGASGAIEAVATVLSLRHKRLPGAPIHGDLDPELPVDLVLGEPRALRTAHAALSTNLAFGGANSVIALLAADAGVVAS